MVVFTISLVGFPSASAASQGKTYTIWSAASIGDSVVCLQKIPDVNNDAHEDVLVVSRVATGTVGGYIRILDGRNGAIIRTSNTLGFEPYEACYVGGYIAVARSGRIGIYDLQFRSQYSIAASSSTMIPDHLQTLSSRYLMFIDGTSVKSYDIQNRGTSWTYQSSSATITNMDFLILSSNRMVVAYPVHNQSYDGWRMDLIDDRGSRIGGTTVGGLRGSISSDSLRLGAVDSSRFILTKMNSTAEALVSYSITGNSFLKSLERQIDHSISNKAFSIGDINSDGHEETIATWSGNLTVCNGVDGSILYITNIDSSSGIGYVVLGDDVDSDGLPEVAVNIGNSLHLLTFSDSSYVERWDPYVDNYDGLIAIQDVDGDGHRDFITASGTNITCIWGSYDNQPPSFSSMNLSINSTSTTKDLIANWTCSDTTSGIQRYEVRMDQGSWENLGLTTHCVFTSLSQGDHEFSIRAIDNAGNIAFKQFTVSVDTTPPTVFITYPTSDSVTSSTVVAAWSGQAGASEIDHYMIRVDEGSWQNVGKATNCILHSLSDGVHVVEVEAVDKAGINSTIQSTSFTVNTSLVGGPGWIDDLVIFTTVIGVLGLSGIIVRRRSVNSAKSAPISKRKYCTSCGILISYDAVYCPQCGTKLPPTHPTSKMNR